MVAINKQPLPAATHIDKGGTERAASVQFRKQKVKWFCTSLKRELSCMVPVYADLEAPAAAAGLGLRCCWVRHKARHRKRQREQGKKKKRKKKKARMGAPTRKHTAQESTYPPTHTHTHTPICTQ